MADAAESLESAAYLLRLIRNVARGLLPGTQWIEQDLPREHLSWEQPVRNLWVVVWSLRERGQVQSIPEGGEPASITSATECRNALERLLTWAEEQLASAAVDPLAVAEDETRDGPVYPSGFRWRGTLHSIPPLTQWPLLRALFGHDHVTTDELLEAVFGHDADEKENALRVATQRLTRTLTRLGIPLEVVRAGEGYALRQLPQPHR